MALPSISSRIGRKGKITDINGNIQYFVGFLLHVQYGNVFFKEPEIFVVDVKILLFLPPDA